MHMRVALSADALKSFDPPRCYGPATNQMIYMGVRVATTWDR
jgi:hypothetical protein